jgi:hypothetical protein
MDRRKTLLGAAGAALLSQLQACGTGDADTASVDSLDGAGAPSESGSAISEKAPTNYAPILAGGHHHIEVACAKDFLSGAITLDLHGTRYTIGLFDSPGAVTAEKEVMRPIRLGEMHSEGNWRGYLTLATGPSNIYINTKTTNPNTTNPNWKHTVSYRDTKLIHHFDFFSSAATNRRHLASVRLIQKDTAIRVATNLAVMFEHSKVPDAVINRTLTARPTLYPGIGTLPRPDRTSSDLASYRRSIDIAQARTVPVINGIDGADMIILPKFTADGKHSGHVSMAPLFTYLNGDPNHLEAATIAAEQQLADVYKTAVNKQFSLNTKSFVDVHATIGEEILKLFGGKALIEDYRKLREAYVEAVKTADLDTYDLLGSLRETGVHIRNDNTVDFSGEVSRMLTNSLRDRGGSKAGGLFNNATAVQLGCVLPSLYDAVVAWPPISTSLQVGFRLSLVLQSNRKYWGFGGANDGPTKNYSIVNVSSDGVRFSFTGTIGYIKIWGVSISIEGTFNLSIKDGKWRINNFTFDPVFDTKAIGIVRRLLNYVFKDKYDDREFGAEAVFFGKTVETLQKPPCQTWFVPDRNGVIGILKHRDYTGFSDAETKEFQDGAFEVDRLLPTSSSTQSKSFVEASPFRFVLVNGQVADETGPFEAGFKGNLLWGWAPGVKMLNQVIYEKTFGVTGKIFLRLQSNVEFSFVFGSTDFEYAYGNVFQI